MNAGSKRLWRKDGQVFHRAVTAGERPAYLEARASGISERWRKITERVASFFAGWFRDELVSRVSVVA